MFENELLGAIGKSNLTFIKRYMYAFIVECEHFYNMYPELGKLVKSNGGQAYRLIKKVTPVEDDNLAA